MFSRRSFVPQGETELSALHRAAPPGWLDLSAANPTTIGLERPDYAALLAAAGGPYAPDPRGWLPARRALVTLYGERGVVLEESDLVLCASTSEAYSQLLMALCDPGDAILV